MKRTGTLIRLLVLLALALLVACSTADGEETPAVDGGGAASTDEADGGWLDWDGRSAEPDAGEERADGAGADLAEDAGMEMESDGAMVEEELAMAPDPAAAPPGAAGDDAARAGETVAQNSALTAGEVDDNANWDDYLLYLRDYQGPRVIRVDVSERHQIRVVNEAGDPVLGALVRVLADGEEVQRLRTHSDGRAFFFPRALPAAAQAEGYVLEVEAAGAVTEVEIPAGTLEREWEIVHAAAGEPQVPARLDILFLIDATGSMADEIRQLKDNIQAIARQIDALPAQPDVRFGMTIYRDRGDAFVSRTFDFTPDVDTFAEALAQVQAGGGGDYPEDLNEALTRAIHAPEWRVMETVSLIFLVADAPPHLDYADQQTTYANEMMEAASRGIKIYPIASSGLDRQGEYIFRQLAQVTGGRFIFLTYGAGGPGTTGTETEHQVADYTVSALDDLVVRVVEEELAPLVGQETQ